MVAKREEDREGCPFCSFFEQFRDAEVHVLNAKQEILMAIRAVVDHEIEMTRRSMNKRKKDHGARKVEID